MSPGGSDRIFVFKYPAVVSKAADMALWLVDVGWPSGMIEVIPSGHRVTLAHCRQTLTREELTGKELLIYRDVVAMDALDKLGVVEATRGALLHLLQSEDSFTIVYDQETPVARLVDDVTQAIKVNFLTDIRSVN